jgi:hypothetical protein
VPQAKLRWPRELLDEAPSPDAKYLAIWDAKGVYLTDSRGKHAVRLRVTQEIGLANQSFKVSFAFNPQSSRLAILTTCGYGEPGISELDRLYWLSVARPKTRRIAEWHEAVQGTGVAILGRELLGWSPDGDSIRMQAKVWEGEDMPGGGSVDNESTKSASFDVTRPRTWNTDALASHLH